MIEEARKQWLDGRDVYSNTILLFSKFAHGGENIIENPECFSYPEIIMHYLRKLFCFITKKDSYYVKTRGRIFYFQDINEVTEIKHGLVLFDEAQVLFNARNWEKLSDEFSYKLQQHRKHDLDLMCTTQNLGTIDINYRRLIQHWVHCERGFTIGADKVIMGIFFKHTKDIDMLYNSIDDLKCPTILTKWRLIHMFKPRYYDTYYDIGFKSIRTICLTSYDQSLKKMKMKMMIVPKKMSLNEGLRFQSLLKSALGVSKSTTLKKTWK